MVVAAAAAAVEAAEAEGVVAAAPWCFKSWMSARKQLVFLELRGPRLRGPRHLEVAPGAAATRVPAARLPLRTRA